MIECTSDDHQGRRLLRPDSGSGFRKRQRNQRDDRDRNRCADGEACHGKPSGRARDANRQPRQHERAVEASRESRHDDGYLADRDVPARRRREIPAEDEPSQSTQTSMGEVHSIPKNQKLARMTRRKTLLGDTIESRAWVDARSSESSLPS